MSAFEATHRSPVAWMADQLARTSAVPVRRAVVLVASERHAHAIRRLVCLEWARPELLAGVLFVRPVEFARELLLRAGTVRLPGWEEVRRLRILQLFEAGTLAGALRYFNAEQLRSGQGYVDAFARTIADLEASGLDVAVALRVSTRLARQDVLAADRLHDVGVVWEAADRGRGARTTTAQVLWEATELVVARPQIAAECGAAFALLAASPSTLLLRFLRALPDCRVVFQEARPLRADTQRWRPLVGLEPHEPPAAAEYDQPTLRSELALVQRFLFEKPENLTAPDRARSEGADGSVDLEEYASIDEEIEAAATWVTEQVGSGIPLEQIALIVPEIDPYAGRLADRLARVAGGPDGPSIRVSVASGLSLSGSPAGMRLQGLLAALVRGLEAEATIRVLPSLHREGTVDGNQRLSPSRAAEIVYGSGIIGGSPGDRAGLREWQPKLLRRRAAMRRLAEQQVAAAAGSAADEPEKRLDARARHEAARWLRDVEPILPAIVEMQQLADAVLAGLPLGATWKRLRAFCDRWLRIPPDPPDLLTLLDERLQPMLTDPLAGAIRGPTALRILMEVLRGARRATTRFGEACVFVGTAAHAAGLQFASVRVLGLAEGALPHAPHDDPIVPDTLRKRIEDAARAEQPQPDIVLPRLADHVLDDLHDVLRVVCGTMRHLALSAPRQWTDRSEREVSGIMLEAATALGRNAKPAREEGDVPTAARLRAVYLTPGRAVRRRYADACPLTSRALLESESMTVRQAASVAVPSSWTHGAARALDRLWRLAVLQESDTLSDVDGIVGEAWPTIQPPGLVAKRPISQSALTMLLTCPYRFLQERILYLSEPVSRPSVDVIAPIDYGALFHAAAERFFLVAGPALCRREGSLEQWVVRARAIASEQFDALRLQYPMRGEDGIERERNRLLRQIEQLVQYEWHLPLREFLNSELSFGDPDPVRLALDGGDLFVWGAIDRVDRIGPGALAVRDLKTGRVRDFGEDPINAGRDLQIGLYVLALEISGDGTPVGHAAYVHPSVAQEPDRSFTGDDLELLRRQTREWLSIARQLLSAGAFPHTPNPEDCAYCPFVPACGDGAQQRSAVKLSRLPPGHPLEPFARFKRQDRKEEA